MTRVIDSLTLPQAPTKVAASSPIAMPGSLANSGSAGRITTSNLKVDVRYRQVVNTILDDRDGRRTWPQLEKLEHLAEREPAARQALERLDLLSHVRDYQEVEAVTPEFTVALAQQLDSSPRRLACEGWSHVLAGPDLKKGFSLLKASRSPVGWSVLGYPATISDRGAGLVAPGWEDPDQWRRLVQSVVRRQMRNSESSQTYREYRKVLAAYQHLEQSDLGGRVDSTSMWFDIHALEDRLRPEQLERARREVRQRITDRQGGLELRPGSKTRGQRFLTSLVRMPEPMREKRLHEEFSYLSLKSPEELRGYAELLQQELTRRGKDPAALRPLIEQVFTRVAREQGRRPQESRDVMRRDSFRRLMKEVSQMAPEPGANVHGDRLEVYRTGLTVGGMSRNYVLELRQNSPASS